MLRYYERLGLVRPERSRGNIRLYSEEDIGRLRYIKALMSDCGVNLAGVQVALRLMQRIKEMQRQLEEMEKKIKMIAEDEVEERIKDIIEDVEWKEVEKPLTNSSCHPESCASCHSDPDLSGEESHVAQAGKQVTRR